MSKSSNIKKYESRNPLKRHFLKCFVKQMMETIPEEGSILEVGCGEGMLLQEIHNRWPNRKLTGVDLSAEAIEEAARRNPDIPVKIANALSLPFESHSFDVVLCAEVLEHLENPEAALDELCRVTSNTIILSVPHEPWFRLGNLLALSHAKTLGNPPDHLNHWTLRSFKKWIEEHLNVQRIATPFPWLIVKTIPK